MRRQRIRQLLGPDMAICAVIAILYLLIWPVGEYGINDEWVYVKSLEHLHFEGRLLIPDCVTASFVGQLFWGLLFTKLFGFSFTSAGLSAVVLQAVECVFLYRTLALCGVDRLPAFGGVLALVFNPLHAANAFSFMTDVPAVAFEFVGLFCYLTAISHIRNQQALKEARGLPLPAYQGASFRELGWLVAGSFGAGEAFLIRQHGLLLPVALFTYAVAFDRRLLTPARCAAAFVPVGVAAVGLTFYQQLCGQPTGYSNAVSAIAERLRHPPMADVPYMLYALFVHAGWFLIPLAAAMRRSLFRARPHVGLACFGLVALAGIDGLLFYGLETGRVFPYIHNMITPFGLFRPDELVIGKRDMLWGELVGWAISVASLLAALALAFRLLCGAGAVGEAVPGAVQPGVRDPDERSDKRRDHPLRLAAQRLFAILLVLQAAYLFVTAPILFDRHLLLSAPTLIALFCLVSGTRQDFSPLRCVACLIPIAVYAIATTHDIHSLSRTVFIAGQALVDRGVDPRTITAGFNFDGWCTYELAPKHPKGGPPGLYWARRSNWEVFREAHQDVEWKSRWDRAWWSRLTSVSTERMYLVATSPGPHAPSASGLITQQVFHYQNWWPWKINSVIIFREARP